MSFRRGFSFGVPFCLVVIGFIFAGCTLHNEGRGKKTPSEKNRDLLLSTAAKKRAVPGAVFAEFNGDQDTPQVYSTGFANLDTQTPMRGDMSFHVGSVTKSFTATAVLMLVDRGLIKLDDTVDTYLPGKLPGGDRITVRNLMLMRSGLTDYHTTPGFAETLDENPMHVWTFNKLAGLVTVNDDPDTYFQYRNINYVALGAILEKVSGHSRAQFVAKEICAPLGLAHTYVPQSAAMPANSARGYVPTEDGFEDMSEAVHPSWAGAAGDMISTARDLVVWLKALNEGALLSEKQHQEMFTMRRAYIHGGFGGYGLGVLSLFGALGHGGDYSGIYTAAMFEYQGRYMVVLVNGQSQEDGGDATAVFFDMARTLYPPKGNPDWMGTQFNPPLSMARE